MNDVYGQTGFDMTDTWTCFGDPSLLVRTDTPSVLTIQHPATTVLGVTSVAVNCNTEGALVCLSVHHNILGTAFVNGGIAFVTFPALSNTDSILVTATAYNHRTVQDYLLVQAPTGPYVISTALSVNDAAGNNNGEADYGETLQLDLQLNNIGISIAHQLTATLSTSDPAVTITNGTCSTLGDINASSGINHASAFGLQVASNVNDGHQVLLNLSIADTSGNIWYGYFYLPLLAPQFNNSALLSVSDPGGNNNGKIDAGETVNLLFHTQNSGHSDAPAAISSLSCNSPYITINNNSNPVGVIQVDSFGNSVFIITASPLTPPGTLVTFDYLIAGGSYSDERFVQAHVSIIVETWENGLGNFNWTMSGSAPWFISTTQPYDGSDCLQSGGITDNQSSTVTLTVNQTAPDSIVFYKRVDSESGYDMLTFYINGVAKNTWSGNIPWSREVFFSSGTGQTTFSWTYAKDPSTSVGADASWIDDIILPQSVATVITEADPGLFAVGVAPNPVHSTTLLSYQLQQSMPVEINVYNMLGQRVAEPEHQVQHAPGTYRVPLDCSTWSAGMYYCVLQLGDQSFTVKLVVQ